MAARQQLLSRSDIRHSRLAWLRDDDVAALAQSVLNEPAAVTLEWTVEPVDYAFASPTTDGLFRIRGNALVNRAEVPWSLFVKVVHSLRHWPVLSQLPPALRDLAVALDAWRYGADLYASRVGAVLPDGLRLPRVHQIRELGDERIALVLEDVRATLDPWDHQHFSRAAQLLGRLAVRLSGFDGLPTSALRNVTGNVVRLHYESRVLIAALPVLAAQSTWQHPLLAGDPALRTDMLALADRMPRILDVLDQLPQVVGHGDASPQNLLIPVEEPDTFVVVDWTLGGAAAAGDDLGQLLIGLAHAGELAPAALPDLHEVIVPAYTVGLAAEGMQVDEADVRYALDGGLAARSAFTALPLERLAESVTDELAEMFAARLELTRYLIDLGLSLAR